MIDNVVSWIRDAGALGMVAYAAVYIIATVSLIPAIPLTAAAGFLYGPIAGTALVSASSVVGATCAFVIGKTFARGWVARRVAANVTFLAIDRALGAGGLRLVALVRLSPFVPFGLLNYALGLTGLSIHQFALGSAIGMLPGTLLYVYLGSLGGAIGLTPGAANNAGTGATTLYWLGLLASVVAATLVTRLAKRALAHELATRAPASGEPPSASR